MTKESNCVLISQLTAKLSKVSCYFKMYPEQKILFSLRLTAKPKSQANRQLQNIFYWNWQFAFKDNIESNSPWTVVLKRGTGRDILYFIMQCWKRSLILLSGLYINMKQWGFYCKYNFTQSLYWFDKNDLANYCLVIIIYRTYIFLIY